MPPLTTTPNMIPGFLETNYRACKTDWPTSLGKYRVDWPCRAAKQVVVVSDETITDLGAMLSENWRRR